MRKRAGERKREGGSRIKWKVGKNKGRGWRYMGIRVWWRKIKRKKKKKRMDHRKKEKKKKNDNLEILPQYFHNKS